MAPRLLERRVRAGRHLLRRGRDLAVDRNQRVRAQVLRARPVLGIGLRARAQHPVRAARDHGFELELDAVRQRARGREVQQAVAVALLARERVCERRLHDQIVHHLVRVVFRHRNPDRDPPGPGRNVPHVDRVGEADGAARGRSVPDLRAGAVAGGDEHGEHCEHCMRLVHDFSRGAGACLLDGGRGALPAYAFTFFQMPFSSFHP
jgi:hypothetical protein